MQLRVIAVAYLLVYLFNSFHQNPFRSGGLLRVNLTGELDAVHRSHLSPRVHELHQIFDSAARLFDPCYLLHILVKLFVHGRKILQALWSQLESARNLFPVQNGRGQLRNVYEFQGRVCQVIVFLIRVHVNLLVFQQLLVGILFRRDKLVRKLAVQQLLQRTNGQVEQVKLLVRSPEKLELLESDG